MKQYLIVYTMLFASPIIYAYPESLIDSTKDSLSQFESVNYKSHFCNDGYDPEVGVVYPIKGQKLGRIKEVVSPGIPDSTVILDTYQDPRNQQILYSTGNVRKDENNDKDIIRVYKSTDGGTTWVPIYDIPGSSSGKITMSEEGTLMILGDTPFNGDAKIYYSQNDGKSFNSFVHGPTKGKVQTIKLTDDGKSAYVADNNGRLFRHDFSNGQFIKSNDQYPEILDGDGKSSWPNAIYSLTTFKDLPGKVFVGAGNHLFRVEANKRPMKMSQGVFNDTTVYNVERTPKGGIRFSGCNGIYETKSGYDFKSERNPTFQKLRSPSFVREKEGKIVSTPGFLRTKWVTTNPSNPNEILASSTSGLYQSQDGGKNWKRLEVFPQERQGTVDEYQKIIWIDKDTAVIQVGAFLNKENKLLKVKLR